MQFVIYIFTAKALRRKGVMDLRDVMFSTAKTLRRKGKDAVLF